MKWSKAFQAQMKTWELPTRTRNLVADIPDGPEAWVTTIELLAELAVDAAHRADAELLVGVPDGAGGETRRLQEILSLRASSVWETANDRSCLNRIRAEAEEHRRKAKVAERTFPFLNGDVIHNLYKASEADELADRCEARLRTWEAILPRVKLALARACLPWNHR